MRKLIFLYAFLFWASATGDFLLLLSRAWKLQQAENIGETLSSVLQVSGVGSPKNPVSDTKFYTFYIFCYIRIV